VTAAPVAWFKNAGVQLGALAAALLVNAIISPGFLNLSFQDGRLYGSVIDILNRVAPVGLIALGMSLVIATRGVDLSVGAVIAISGAAAAAAVNAGQPWPVAMAIGLGSGLLCGLWNGFLVAVLEIQPIVATLILMVAGRGVAQLITDGRILTFVDPHFAALGSGSFLALPIATLVTIVAAIVLLLSIRGSALGLFIEAIGVNPRASRLAGIDTRLVLISVYVASGLLAGLAGLIIAADIRGADANNAGLWLELDAILAAVIGGASLYGGRFSLSLVLVGALILQTVKTGILRSGVPPEFNLIAMALVVATLLALQSERASAFFASRKAKGSA
jgi:galactofuranose transport system permease protein